jgi:hypothetical protein
MALRTKTFSSHSPVFVRPGATVGRIGSPPMDERDLMRRPPDGQRLRLRGRAIPTRMALAGGAALVTLALASGCGTSSGGSSSGGVQVRLTRCVVNSEGDQEATVDVTGVSGYVAAVDLYAGNGQFEDRIVPSAISPQFNPASDSTASGPVDGSTFTCHLASVTANDVQVYTDPDGGQPQPNDPVPPGINLTG